MGLIKKREVQHPSSRSQYNITLTSSHPAQWRGTMKDELFVYIVRMKLSQRLKLLAHRLIALLRTTVTGLNFFPVRHFGNNVDRSVAKHLGQWATRLYLLSLTTAVVILATYTVLQPRASTKTFDKPSFDFYSQLRQEYEDDLKCSCSSVASTFDQFVTVEPDLHQVSACYCSICITCICHSETSRRRHL